MKTLIVYYSLEGNTAWAVNKIAEELGADLERLVPKKAYPDKGFRKFFWGGKSAVMKETPELEPLTTDSRSYERIIFASPIWAGTFAPPLRTYIQQTDLRNKQFALVLCSSGGSTKKAADQLKQLLDVRGELPSISMIDPKTKPDTENDTKIQSFCRSLLKG